MKQKLWLDRVLGWPAAWGANIAARIMGRILKRNHELPQGAVKHILIAKFVGLGSIIQAIPLIKALRGSFPQAKIMFLTTPGNLELLNRLQIVDEVWTINDRSSTKAIFDTGVFIRRCLKLRPEIYFDLELYSKMAGLFSLLSLAINRYGLIRHTSRYKKGLYTHLLYFNTSWPVARIFLQLGRLAYNYPQPPLLEFAGLRPNESDRAGLADKLAAAGLDQGRGLVIINPHASDLLLERRWPLDKFADLTSRILKAGWRPVIIGGGNAESRLAAELVALLPASSGSRVINLAGLTSLGELLALLQLARLIVTNDSGPFHLALSLACPAVALFGPGSPAHYGASRAPETTVICKPIYCSPCLYEIEPCPCNGDNQCLKRITVDEVWQVVEERLDNQPSFQPASFENLSLYDQAHGQPAGKISR